MLDYIPMGGWTDTQAGGWAMEITVESRSIVKHLVRSTISSMSRNHEYPRNMMVVVK